MEQLELTMVSPFSARPGTEIERPSVDYLCLVFIAQDYGKSTFVLAKTMISAAFLPKSVCVAATARNIVQLSSSCCLEN